MDSDGLPGTTEVDASIKLITDNASGSSLGTTTGSRDQLVTLYNKAMAPSGAASPTSTGRPRSTRSGWSESTMANARCRRCSGWPPSCPGPRIAAWKEQEFTELGHRVIKARLSQFMHGEQGAMMVAAKIVETVPWIDAKYYASTQTMDEARHTEVFAKYLDTKLGEAYPMSPFLEEQITALIEDSRWDIAYLGMQIVIESLALAAFGDDAPADRRAAAQEAPALRDVRRGPPRRLRCPHASASTTRA